MKQTLVKVLIAGSIFSVALGAGFANAKTINQTLGGQWQTQCKDAGSRYKCCKDKEKKCIKDGIGKTSCGSRYKICVKKTQAAQSNWSEALETNPVAELPKSKTKRRPVFRNGGTLKLSGN